ncbi:MAG: protein TolQ [Paracoccaceae bacterium]|nr:protein TolQ [Paracoccaceae bacterium]
METVDFSILALFMRATFLVKLVMFALIFASFWSWAIIIQKFINFRRARHQSARFDKAFWSGEPLDLLYKEIGDKPRGAKAKVFKAGMDEWTASYRSDGALIAGTQARIDRSMDVAITRETDKLTQGLNFLATVGSTAPFVGLFGTVWGIKNAFQEIAMQQSTNLAVVAPGIAEALVATALGLLAAIPAVIFYNKLSADADRMTSDLESFADEFSTILSRQLDS